MAPVPQPSVDHILETRRALWLAGYRPLSVLTGQKRPQGFGWQDMARRSPPACTQAASHPASANTGVLCDGLRVLDIDVDDTALADRIEREARKLLGIAPVRYRDGSGKRALFFRAAEGEPVKLAITGTAGKLEVLGRGQQIVVDGLHPEGMPYEWRDPDGVPLDGLQVVPHENLVAITEADLAAFLEVVAPIIGAPAGGLPVRPLPPAGALPLPANDQARQRGRAAAQKALEQNCAALASMGKDSGRNDALNGTAYRLGRFIAAGGLSRAEAEGALEQACSANGLWREDGPNACRATIRSGLESGVAAGPVILGERERQDSAAPVLDPSPLLAGRAAAPQGVAPAPASISIEALPFQWIDPAGIPPRRWLYGKHLIRGFVSATVAPGGVGKSALTMAEGVAVATGRAILGIEPAEQAPVWLLNLEDPMEELYRRLMAIALHYGLTEQDLEPGRFYVNSGRETPLVIAESTRDGIRIARPIIEEVKAQIVAKGIGLMIIDPFVSSHRVPENDNSAINTVASAWREIAEATGCAIELVHHTRKTGGLEVTVEDGRGGSALHGAARSMRAMNGMTKDEAARFGVENHRQFFRVDSSGKANLAPASANADWFQIISLDLGNATPDRPSDHVGVVERWALPDPLEGVTAGHVGQVQSALLAGGSFRRDQQANDWVGHLVGRIIGADTGQGLRGAAVLPGHRAARAKVSTLVSKWIAAGALREERALDTKRNERVFVVAGDVDDEEFASP